MSPKNTEPKVVETKVELDTKVGYKVLDVTAKKTIIKNRRSDIGGDFYIYNLFDVDGKIIAQNRYVYVNSEKQPFNKLSAEDEKILSPPVIENLELIK